MHLQRCISWKHLNTLSLLDLGGILSESLSLSVNIQYLLKQRMSVIITLKWVIFCKKTDICTNLICTRGGRKYLFLMRLEEMCTTTALHTLKILKTTYIYIHSGLPNCPSWNRSFHTSPLIKLILFLRSIDREIKSWWKMLKCPAEIYSWSTKIFDWNIDNFPNPWSQNF